MAPLLTYCATPSRLIHKTDEIIKFVLKQGHAPLHPFRALPQEIYGDKGHFGRETSLGFALRLVDVSQQVYLFGLSERTAKEVCRAIERNIPIKLFLNEFDIEWRRYYSEELKNRHGRFLDAFISE